MPPNNKIEETTAELLSLADIKINGNRPWDIKILNKKFFSRALSQGSIGLGESYMDGWWETKKLDEFFYRLLSAEIHKKIKISWPVIKTVIKSKIINRQSKNRSSAIGEKHYDVGNDLFAKMLGQRMVYTCGYWRHARNLNEAQSAKLDLVCKKLKLKPGMKILDIGCGWGSFIKFAAKKYAVEAVGITVSKKQAEMGKQLCHGLTVEIKLQDYRDTEGKFDRIVSLGMFERVGYKNYRKYMQIANDCLTRDGLFLLQTIGQNNSAVSGDPWTDKYIFPNGMLPSIQQIGNAIENLFIMEDWHNFRTDYDKTLMAWFANFDKNWNYIKNNYSAKFYRMWKYYLLSCAGAFRARNIQLWQIVFSKSGNNKEYVSIR